MQQVHHRHTTGSLQVSTFTPQVHYMCTTCTLQVHHRYTTCTLHVHYSSIVIRHIKKTNGEVHAGLFWLAIVVRRRGFPGQMKQQAGSPKVKRNNRHMPALQMKLYLYINYRLTTCKLQVHYMYTTSTLYGNFRFTTCKLQGTLYVHYMYTTWKLQVHYM